MLYVSLGHILGRFQTKIPLFAKTWSSRHVGAASEVGDDF